MMKNENHLSKENQTLPKGSKPGQAKEAEPVAEKAATLKGLELEFLPEYLEILERPASSAARLFSAAIILLCLCVVAWAYFSHIDIIASAPGRLIVEGRSKTVQAAELGEVSGIFVRDGQKVAIGDVLIELNSTSASAESDRLLNQMLSSQLEIARLEALLNDDPQNNFTPPENVSPERVWAAKQHLIAEHNHYLSQLNSLTSQIEQNKVRQHLYMAVVGETNALIQNTQERLDGRMELLDKGHFPRMGYLELQKEAIEQRQRYAEIQISISELESEEKNLTKQVSQLKKGTQKILLDRLSEERNRLADVSKQLIRADEDSRKMRIIAPVAGVVQQLAIHTLGAVIQPAQELLIIVPKSENLEAEVSILNRDVGFVRPGQQVEVKVESFPYTKYGTIKGEVINVSRDSMEDKKLGLVYLSRIKLFSQAIETDEENIQLLAGMIVSAEIKTGDRRIISYLLSPLQEYQSESMKER